MGKPVHGWFTGWLNLIGSIAVTASVDYGCATFLNLSLNALLAASWAGTLTQAFYLFLGHPGAARADQHLRHRIIDVLQNVSVWWHVFGAAAVVLILCSCRRSTRACSSCSPSTSTTSGFATAARAAPFWFYVLPLGFLLTQYTITGFDACAHVSEETKAPRPRRRGLWQSIFYSAIGGWILLLAFLFAATDVDAINAAVGFSGAIFAVRADAVLLQGPSSSSRPSAVLLRHELRDQHVPA
jgi:amino acid transporter